MKNDSENNEDVIVIPPVECLENGCKKRSEKCFDCPHFGRLWFYVPKKKNNES